MTKITPKIPGMTKIAPKIAGMINQQANQQDEIIRELKIMNTYLSVIFGTLIENNSDRMEIRDEISNRLTCIDKAYPCDRPTFDK